MDSWVAVSEVVSFSADCSSEESQVSPAATNTSDDHAGSS